MAKRPPDQKGPPQTQAWQRVLLLVVMNISGGADAPMNDGLIVPMGASPQTFWVSGALLPGGDAKATHPTVFCKSGLGRLHSCSRAICLSFDVNEDGRLACWPPVSSQPSFSPPYAAAGFSPPPQPRAQALPCVGVKLSLLSRIGFGHASTSSAR